MRRQDKIQPLENSWAGFPAHDEVHPFSAAHYNVSLLYRAIGPPPPYVAARRLNRYAKVNSYKPSQYKYGALIAE
jgi:hypothetical protein